MGPNNPSRREILLRGGRFALAAAAIGLPTGLASAAPEALDIAYAGSMSSVMEGPIKRALAQAMNLDLHGRAQGSSALAQLIISGSIRPDVFIPITPGPMQIVLRTGKAESAQAVARTEMVIAYSPRSRFAPRFEAAAKTGGDSWLQLLEEPDLRFGRTDPITDPQGRNIIFTMMLAAKLYGTADLREKILGAPLNEKQIFTEPSLQARLQSGELDAASAYKIQPGPFHLTYLSLPKEINLSGDNVHAEHPEVSLRVGGKAYTPEPLIYYAAALKDAPNPKGAVSFCQWLTGEEASTIFRRYNYDPPGKLPALRA